MFSQVAGITGGSAWTYDNFRKQYYLHQFLTEQADLNYENEDVIEDMIVRGIINNRIFIKNN